MPNHAERYERALISLEGLSVADALGGFFELSPPRTFRIVERLLPGAFPWHWTDDTQMALSVVAVLREHQQIDQDALVAGFVARYQRWRGYGKTTRGLLSRIATGADWREESQAIFGGTGSHGNGSAMRVPPLGAYFADDLPRLVVEAEKSALVTHANPEAVAGAIAASVAAALSWNGREQPAPSIPAFFDELLPWVPESKVRDGLIRASDLPPETDIVEAGLLLGNGSNISAQDTVPLALWCAAKRIDNYEEAIWLTLEAGGDCDTTAAIAGGIVVLRTGVASIPAHWREAREPLPL